MPSGVGKQAQEYEVIRQAIALELDCVAAFTEAAKQVESGNARKVFAQIASECAEHARLWRLRLYELGDDNAGSNRVTAWLNRVKVQVIAPFGERAIAYFVSNNPADCITAYQRVRQREDLQARTRELAAQMLRDASFQREMVRDARR